MNKSPIKSIRHALLGGCAVIALAPSLAAAQAAAPQSVTFNIPAQSLDGALTYFGQQSGREIIASAAVTRNRRAPELTGAYTPEQALSMLLAQSGLTYRTSATGSIVVEVAQDPQGGSAAGGGAEVEALIVTAQKKEEQIQDVPIAISAFTQKSLDAQKLEGGFDLLKAIPNVSFSKSNFSGYNFSIRGIGTKAVSATTDPAVAVAFNNTTLIVNRLFEQEYFDVERVEVLRGPQGTLFGRNAPSGVINVISARPRLGEFEGDIKLETGNYNARRARAMVNIPVGETLALRVAGALTQRDGYGTNLAASDPLVTNDVREDVDGRDLWSLRTTVGWEPIEQIRVNLLWERFQEDDNRVRTSKQLCHHDAGPDFVGNFDQSTYDLVQRAGTSQGCLAGSLYAPEAFGTPNGASLPYISGLFQGPSIGTVGLLSNYNRGDSVGFPGLGGSPYFTQTAFPHTGNSDEFGTAPLAPRCARDSNPLQWWLSPLNLCEPDPYGGRMQSTDLRTIHSQIEPTYRAKADIFELSVDLDLTDSLTLTSQTVYSTDEYYASQDYNRYTTSAIFNDSATACGGEMDIFGKYIEDCRPEALGTAHGGFYNVTPGGVFTDPQLGPSSSLVAQDLSRVESEQFNQEFRIASNYDADFNFSLGTNFTHFETMNDYFVFLNAASLLTHFFPFNTHAPSARCGAGRQGDTQESFNCIYVDPNPLESINGEGHNYFRSANPYKLTSSAIFGELYWQATDTVKVTAGARLTWDRKVFTPIPSQLLLDDYRKYVPVGSGPEACLSLEFCQLAGTGVGGRGSPADPDIVQEWREPTGRLIVDWKPELGFTDETMVYGSLARGYKGGGANPPPIGGPAGLLSRKNSGDAAAPPTFEPEYINAFEVGTKNTLFGGALILNGSGFFYDYTGYQVSKIIDRSAANENFDAKVFGLEAEWIFSPTRNLRFNGTFGALRTEIADGERSIDLMDRAAGGNTPFTTPAGVTFDEWMVVKPWVSSSSNCVVPVAVANSVLGSPVPIIVNGVDISFNGPHPVGTNYANWGIWALCPAGNVVGNSYRHPDAPGTGIKSGFPGIHGYTPETDAPNGGAGFFKELGGNDLPNAPHWTASLGAQYRMPLPGGWDATLRGDFYWQAESYARVYNTEYDRLEAWTNTNFSLWVENPDLGVTAEVYVKNAFDETPITDAFLNSDDSGLTTNVFTLDPRLVGVSIRKSF